MNNILNVVLSQKNIKVSVPKGITPLELFDRYMEPMEAPVMNAQVNHKTISLSEPLYEECNLCFIDYSQESGMRTYLRTFISLLSRASINLKDIREPRIDFEHAISNGYYCAWGSREKAPTQEEVEALSREVRALIAQALPIKVISMPTEEAIRYLEEKGGYTTAEMIRTLGRCYTPLVEIDGHREYIFGNVLPNTSMIWDFILEPFQDGILIRLPKRSNYKELNERVDQPKLLETFKSHIELLRTLGVEETGPMNCMLRDKDTAAELVQVSEAMQEKQIADIAQEISRLHSERGVRIVLIAGPSSSGKTTTSKRLRTQLITNLLRPFTLSLDDFFVDREKTPLNEDGSYDFESIYALDLPYLNETLSEIVAGEEVELPTFDFTTGSRVFKGNSLKLGADHILIIEGIHALNPELTSQIPQEKIFRIYVSALTSITLDRLNFLSTSDNRLIRRIIRDSKYRNHSAVHTLAMWNSVRRGEEKWIFPFQENADVMFNSAMLYELAALRPIAEPILRAVKQIEPEYAEAQRLLHLLSHFEPIGLRSLPPTSLLREFIGGSSFKY
ncbi:MAG: nucleoside kinase [Porphyromonas sp.]|nr:nucleoside kinase [Porphyromonas sp.]